jgi:hypothetical protein
VAISPKRPGWPATARAPDSFSERANRRDVAASSKVSGTGADRSAVSISWRSMTATESSNRDAASGWPPTWWIPTRPSSSPTSSVT